MHHMPGERVLNGGGGFGCRHTLDEMMVIQVR